jgi:lycopene cyclase domain-containing protein
MHFIYIGLILFTISYPLFKSFEDKIQYSSKWKFLLPGLLISGTFFIIWDIWFTSIGIWKFNPDYVLGLFIGGLPIEEWLFFIVVPFSCVFIYEVMIYFVKKDVLGKQSKIITIILILISSIIAVLFRHQLYTLVTFSLLALFLLFHLIILKTTYLGRFYLAWLICLIPFFMVNGVLTAMPVLIYNDTENMGIRIYTIPLEDAFYGMLNVLQVVTVYEWLKNKKA